MLEVVIDDKVLRVEGFKSGIQMVIDYDDVDHTRVLKATQAMVAVLNAQGF